MKTANEVMNTIGKVMEVKGEIPMTGVTKAIAIDLMDEALEDALNEGYERYRQIIWESMNGKT